MSAKAKVAAVFICIPLLFGALLTHHASKMAENIKAKQTAALQENQKLLENL